MKLDRNKYLDSRSLRPRTLLFSLILVNLILGVIVFVYTNSRWSQDSDMLLKFVSYEELLGTDTIAARKVEVQKVLNGVEPSVEDTLLTKETGQDTTLLVAIDVPIHRQIILPPDNPEALKSLVHALKTESKEKVVRILHYGDSQLEGDRVTNYLRYRLQQRFGGTGTGLILPKEPASFARRNFTVSESKNISKKAIYIKKNQPKNHAYGIGCAVFNFTGNFTQFVGWDTTINGSQKPIIKGKYEGKNQDPAYIRIKKNPMGYKSAQNYQKVTLLYKSDSYCEAQLDAGSRTYTKTLSPQTHGYGTWNVTSANSLKLSFSNGNPPLLYGITLDGYTGVAVDNVGMRGSSGLGFSKMNTSILGNQMKHLNVRAIILQYGINVAPNELKDYTFYKRILIKQIKSLQAAQPGVSIIVIGPSDMGKNKDGEIVSYANIPLIRDAMKEAAMQTNCCFWDLYAAMGGANSMKSWVDQGLAQKDYTHFSYKGAKYVGEMLYLALMQQVEKN